MDSLLQAKVVGALNGTRRSLRDVCDDFNLDYEELARNYNIGVSQCSHCNIWQRKLVEDLDGNPICRFCVDLIGM